MEAGIVRGGRTLLAATMAAALVAGVLFVTSGAAYAASVTPEFLPGASNSDKTCDANEGPGQVWLELKKDPPGGGVVTDGTLSVTITNYTSNSFDWSSNIGVDAVIVKTGADGANLYRYDPPAESTGDTGLVTPGQNAISHISFCYDADQTTTTSTTAPSTTSTTAGPTTTVGGPTTTLESPTTTEQPTTTTLGDEVLNTTITAGPSTTVANVTGSTFEDEVLDEEILPFTGYAFEGLLIVASALALLGALLLSTRRQMED